jgi:hypothetical protein
MLLQLRSFSTLFLILAAAFTYGQVELSSAPRGGGSYSDCDTSMHVDFTVEPLGDLLHQLSAVIDAGTTVPVENHWAYVSNDQLVDLTGDSVIAQFEYPGETPICLAVFAFDMATSQPCTTAVCKFVDIVQDPSCLQLQPDFSISGINSNTITFQDNSPFVGSTTAVWSYGDGDTSTTVAENTFDGPGPHQVCLTLIGPPPINCTSTVCKWLYLGPGELDCGTLLQPGFIHYQDQNFVVVLDTSITTGQSTQTNWDFGDGETAEGRIALHFYDFEGAYQVCANVDVWGPLADDTCNATVCQWVGPSVAVIEDRTMDQIGIYPNPASTSIQMELPLKGPADLFILSMDGRVVRTLRITSDAPIAIEDLSPGSYLLQIRGEQGSFTGRFTKL